jgi:hypothetical protein
VPIHTVGLSFKTDAGSVPISTIPFIDDTEINGNYLVPAGQTKEYDIAFAFADVNDYVIHLLNGSGTGEATAGAVTAKFNSTTTPAPSVSLLAKKPVWHAPGFGTTSVFTVDVTKVFLVNTGTTDVIVAIRIGTNLGV